jgi:hypothetical protein
VREVVLRHHAKKGPTLLSVDAETGYEKPLRFATTNRNARELSKLCVKSGE